MKILFTGASSFTGFWFVKALAAAGHEIVCPLTRDLDSYAGTRGLRIELLKPVCRFIPRAPFGSEHFLKLAGSETFESFQSHCRAAGLPLGKFVVPNPFGPLEEPRFTAFLMNNWQAGRPGEIKTPDYVRDNIHADLLAAAYAKFAAETAASKAPVRKINPSGYVETQGEFAQRVAREVKARLGWACELKLAKQEDFSEPLNRATTDPAAKLAPEWNESKAWDAFAEFYAA